MKNISNKSPFRLKRRIQLEIEAEAKWNVLVNAANYMFYYGWIIDPIRNKFK